MVIQSEDLLGEASALLKRLDAEHLILQFIETATKASDIEVLVDD